MVLASYKLFTRIHQLKESFDDEYCELPRRYDLAEAKVMNGKDLCTIMNTPGIKDENVRKKFLKIYELQRLMTR